MALPRILVADNLAARPRPGELLVWLGAGLPPHRGAARARTLDQAVDLVGGPAEVRVALSDPGPFLRRLAGRAQARALAA